MIVFISGRRTNRSRYPHTHSYRYGDIVPSSTLSRVVVLACVFFFLATIPYQIGARALLRRIVPHHTEPHPILSVPLTPTNNTQLSKTPGKLMEALTTRSRSYYSSTYFRPVRGTEHILILGRVTYTVLAR